MIAEPGMVPDLLLPMRVKTFPVTIMSSPSGAQFKVGAHRGTTPATVQLPSGSAKVKITMAGYESYSGSVRPEAGGTTVKAMLRPHGK